MQAQSLPPDALAVSAAVNEADANVAEGNAAADALAEVGAASRAAGDVDADARTDAAEADAAAAGAGADAAADADADAVAAAGADIDVAGSAGADAGVDAGDAAGADAFADACNGAGADASSGAEAQAEHEVGAAAGADLEAEAGHITDGDAEGGRCGSTGVDVPVGVDANAVPLSQAADAEACAGGETSAPMDGDADVEMGTHVTADMASDEAADDAWPPPPPTREERLGLVLALLREHFGAIEQMGGDGHVRTTVEGRGAGDSLDIIGDGEAGDGDLGGQSRSDRLSLGAEAADAVKLEGTKTDDAPSEAAVPCWSLRVCGRPAAVHGREVPFERVECDDEEALAMLRQVLARAQTAIDPLDVGGVL
eukprot:1101092-Pleurochrysis_carterae.AAC.6